MLAHLLIMDDQLESLGPMIERLEGDGYAITCANNADKAKDVIRMGSIDLAILDADMMPAQEIERLRLYMISSGQEPFVPEEGQGYRLAAWAIQNFPDMGIIILSSQRIDPQDRIAGFNQGADDYIIKTTPIDEIVARVRALLKRIKKLPIDRVYFDAFELDRDYNILTKDDGENVSLTQAEFRLLCAFADKPHQTLQREYLYEAAFPNSASKPSDRAIDTLVSKLRQKLEDGLMGRSIISTVRGQGYRFDAEITRTHIKHRSYVPKATFT